MNKNQYKNELTDYFLNLGIFIHEFAKTERILFSCVTEISGMQVKHAKILLSAARSDILKVSIKKLLGNEIDPMVVLALDQFGAITSARNHIIHNSADLTPGNFISSNKARSAKSERVIPVSGYTLKTMADDTKNIYEILYWRLLVNYYKFPDLEPKWSQIIEDNNKALSTTWQYKPS